MTDIAHRRPSTAPRSPSPRNGSSIWWAFRRHRLAMAGLVVTIAALRHRGWCPASSPSTTRSQQNARAAYHPPQAIHFVDTDADGGWSIRPYIHPSRLKRDPQTLAAVYSRGHARKIRSSILRRGLRIQRPRPVQHRTSHLFATDDPRQPLFLVGRRPARPLRLQPHHAGRADLAVGRPRRRVPVADHRHRCSAASRAITAAASISSMQRVIEFVLSLPSIPIWLALAAALPQDWPATAATIS